MNKIYKIFYRLFRKIIFLFPPEFSHYLVLKFISFNYFILKYFFKFLFDSEHDKLKRNLLGLDFKNPIGLAAGFDKNADYIRELTALGFGFIEIGTVTPLAQKGNAKPRIFRLSSDNALINRLGFNNKGVKYVVHRLRKVTKNNMIIGVNIGKNKDQNDFISDYTKCFYELHNYVDYFTINVSSPNTPGLRDLQNIDKLTDLLKAIVKINNSLKIKKPILLKISPDLHDNDILDIVKLLLSLKIDGIVCTNTTISRDCLEFSKNKISKIGLGGVSGKPLLNRSNHIIKLVRKNVPASFVIIGVGGIMKGGDALEKLQLGADLVQFYTGLVYKGPFLLNDIKSKIIDYEY